MADVVLMIKWAILLLPVILTTLELLANFQVRIAVMMEARTYQICSRTIWTILMMAA